MFLALLTVALAGCGHDVHAAGAAQSTTPAGDPQYAAKLHFYQAQVQPALQTNCFRCHGGMNRRGGLDMTSRTRLLQGGKDGAVVIPGRPEDSLLARVIDPKLPEDDPMRMPPKGTRLTPAEVSAIRRWIADGAVMDR